MRLRTNISTPQPSVGEMTIALAQLPRALAMAQPEIAPASDLAHTWLLRLMEEEGPGVLRMLWRFLGSEADVMDAYQDCFCKLALRKSHADLLSVRAYLYRTASNIAIEIIRARARRKVHLPHIAEHTHRVRESAPVSEPVEAVDSALADSHHLREAIAELPVHLRQVIVLRDLSGLSYREIGRLLAIDPATARVYRRHAVVKLSERLAQAQGGNP